MNLVRLAKASQHTNNKKETQNAQTISDDAQKVPEKLSKKRR